MPGAAPGGAPPMPPPPGVVPPGPTGPSTVAPNKQAERMRGMVMANMGLDVLDKAVALLGSQSEEGQDLMQALVKLRRRFGGASKDLSQAEMKLMGARQPGVQQPGQMPGAGAKSRLASMFPPGAGAGPGGPPPGAGGAM